MNADPFPLGIAINLAAHRRPTVRTPRWSLVGGMFGDGTIDGAGVASVGSERGGLTACRFDNNTITGKPLASGPLGGAYGVCPECLQ